MSVGRPVRSHNSWALSNSSTVPEIARAVGVPIRRHMIPTPNPGHAWADQVKEDAVVTLADRLIDGGVVELCSELG